MPTIDITGPLPTASGSDGRRVFTPDALRFVGDLEAKFGPVRASLLQARRARDAEIKAGASYGLLAETEPVRRGSWKVATNGCRRAPAAVEPSSTADEQRPSHARKRKCCTEVRLR